MLWQFCNFKCEIRNYRWNFLLKLRSKLSPMILHVYILYLLPKAHFRIPLLTWHTTLKYVFPFAVRLLKFCICVLGSLRSCPLHINPLCLSREEGMIHLFVGSHVKKPESGLFSDWIGNNTNDLRRSDWPKRRHPLVAVDFSLHFCLRNEQWIHMRVRYEISAGSVFINLKNS